MLNYEKDGRMAVLLFLGKYVVKTYPTVAESLGLTNKQHLAKLLKDRLEKDKLKARIAIDWRKQLAAKLMLADDEIVRATNTILEVIEDTLAKGEPVRIKHFGDFLLTERDFEGTKINTVRFKISPSWLRDLNPPHSDADLGLKRKYGKRLERKAPSKTIQSP
jgi:hypothetical protein